MHVLKNLGKMVFFKKILLGIIFSLPIISIFIPYLMHPKNVLIYDWEYFSQMYEAFRISVLQYHQFPWFNPWVAGGVPLYANPQFGLISIQALLVLMFGTLLGLKIAVIAYALLGLWGMYYLLRYNQSPFGRSILLGYIFVLGGFGIYHVTGGHLTFAIYYLVPLLLLGFQRMLKESRWLAFALILSLCLLTASHYIILQFILVLFGLITLTLFKRPYGQKTKTLIMLYLKAFGLTALLTGHKLFYSYQYLRSYPRIGTDGFAVSVMTIIKSLLIPPSANNHIQPLGLHYSWGEYSAYSGIIFLLIFFAVVALLIRNRKLINQTVFVTILIIFGALLLAFGKFSKFSPFNLLHKLPVYSSMIVPARWMGWVFLGMVLLVGFVKLNEKSEKLVSLLLVFAVIEMSIFTITYIQLMNPKIDFKDYEREKNTFEQYDDFSKDQYGRYLRATRANYGEVRGYEAILDYNYYRPTNRCGINKGCNFILTPNASLKYWSPNKIIISRTKPGPIKINLNPGSYWLVNGKRLWPDDKVVVLTKDFVLTDEQEKYELTISPPLALRSQ